MCWRSGFSQLTYRLGRGWGLAAWIGAVHVSCFSTVTVPATQSTAFTFVDKNPFGIRNLLQPLSVGLPALLQRRKETRIGVLGLLS